MGYVVCAVRGHQVLVHRESCGYYHRERKEAGNWSRIFDTREEAEEYARGIPRKIRSGHCRQCRP